MRMIDADAIHSTLADWQLMLSETYGTNDEFVRCLEDVLCTVDNTPTIAAPRWHRVEEPPDMDEYVLAFDGDIVVMASFDGEKWWQHDTYESFIISPSYWMPLPEPPQEVQDETEIQG